MPVDARPGDTAADGELIDNALPPSASRRLGELELTEPDFNKFAELAHAVVPAASLSGATAGDLERSLRQREVRRPNGFADELRAVLTGPTGSWGALTLLREAGRPNFTATDVKFVASLAGTLADGVRRATLLEEALVAGLRSDTGFLVLDADNGVEMANPAAEEWLDELAPTRRSTDPLPAAVRAVATQTRRVAAGAGARRPAPASTRAAAVGSWCGGRSWS